MPPGSKLNEPEDNASSFLFCYLNWLCIITFIWPPKTSTYSNILPKTDGGHFKWSPVSVLSQNNLIHVPIDFFAFPQSHNNSFNSPLLLVITLSNYCYSGQSTHCKRLLSQLWSINCPPPSIWIPSHPCYTHHCLLLLHITTSLAPLSPS